MRRRWTGIVVRSGDGQVSNRAFYAAIGATLDGGVYRDRRFIGQVSGPPRSRRAVRTLKNFLNA